MAVKEAVMANFGTEWIMSEPGFLKECFYGLEPDIYCVEFYFMIYCQRIVLKTTYIWKLEACVVLGVEMFRLSLFHFEVPAGLTNTFAQLKIQVLSGQCIILYLHKLFFLWLY